MGYMTSLADASVLGRVCQERGILMACDMSGEIICEDRNYLSHGHLSSDSRRSPSLSLRVCGEEFVTRAVPSLERFRRRCRASRRKLCSRAADVSRDVPFFVDVLAVVHLTQESF